jgi:hypothetical protein
MVPAFPRVITSSTQAWRLIEKDYTLRLSLVASEWATEHLKAWNEVFAEGRRRGNVGYYGHALVEMETADAGKRAEWAFETCCKIWEIQGRKKCKPFFRAIFDWCLQPMFATREACFRDRLQRYQLRTRRHLHSGIIGHMTRRMGQLRAEWNTKLEIATRDNEYQEQLAREREFELERERLARLAAESARTAKTASKRQRKRLTRRELARLRIVFGALQAGLKGLKYCVELDRKRLATPADWIEGGCPSSYRAAYSEPRWRKRIQDQKNRYQEKYDRMSESERSRIVSG